MVDSFLPRPLYVMVKPPVDVLAAVRALSRSDHRAPGLDHVTLMPVGERRTPPGRMQEVANALESFETDTARIIFDRIHDSARTVALRGSRTIIGICRLQVAIRRHLLDHGITLPRYTFRPHITLSYRSDGRGSAAIDPISWLVEDVLLIESVHGEGRHIEHGRWRLRARVPT